MKNIRNNITYEVVNGQLQVSKEHLASLELKTKITNNKRYRLHSKIKKLGYRYSAQNNTIYIPYNNLENLAKEVLTLKNEFNYSIQIEIV